MKIQLVNLSIVASSILVLSATWSNSLVAQEFSKLKQSTFKPDVINGCVSEARKQNMNEAQAQSYCSCFANNLERRNSISTQQVYGSVFNTSGLSPQKSSGQVSSIFDGVAGIESIARACMPSK
jgi:hypothetical protein